MSRWREFIRDLWRAEPVICLALIGASLAAVLGIVILGVWP